MNLEKLGHFSQFISILVLVFGVALVVWELQQTRRLAQAQLESDSFGGSINRGIAQMGERYPDAMAKACRGEALDEEDALVLASRFQVLLSHVAQQRQVSVLAGFGPRQWTTRARASFVSVFSTEAGRNWWRSIRSTYEELDPELVDVGDSILETMGPSGCMQLLDAIRERGA